MKGHFKGQRLFICVNVLTVVYQHEITLFEQFVNRILMKDGFGESFCYILLC